MTPDMAGIPEELRLERAWCVWRSEARDGKPTKVPQAPDGRAFRSNDPATWATFEAAVEAFERGGVAGIGRAITGDLVGVDVDWRHREPPEPPEWLGRVLEMLDSWAETSPSGLGCHVWIRGRWNGAARLTRFPDGSVVEVYDAGSPRYFTVTGKTMLTSPATIRGGEDAQAALDLLAEELAKATAKPASKSKSNGRAHDIDELEGAPEGSRRAALTSKAGRLRALGVSRGEARAVLEAIAVKCSPPVPVEHVDEILEWAWRKPAGEPRRCPVCAGSEPCAAHPTVPPQAERQPGEDDDARDREVCACGSTTCEDPSHDARSRTTPEALALEHVSALRQRHRDREAAGGLPMVWDGILVDAGVFVGHIGPAKIGKTTLGMLLAHTAGRKGGGELLGRIVAGRRVLVLAIEDPSFYTEALADRLFADADDVWIYTDRLKAEPDSLERIVQTIREKGIGLVVLFSLSAFWLVRDENDNAQVQMHGEAIRDAARRSRVPWLIDIHARKAEGADGSEIRGAGALAGVLDAWISQRRGARKNGENDSVRHFEVRGRLPHGGLDIVARFNADEGTYEVIASEKSLGPDIADRCRMVAAQHEGRLSFGALIRGLGMTDGGKYRSALRKALLADGWRYTEDGKRSAWVAP